MNGEEPEDDSWILDWADWAGAYKILSDAKSNIGVLFRHYVSKPPIW